MRVFDLGIQGGGETHAEDAAEISGLDDAIVPEFARGVVCAALVLVVLDGHGFELRLLLRLRLVLLELY